MHLDDRWVASAIDSMFIMTVLIASLSLASAAEERTLSLAEARVLATRNQPLLAAQQAAIQAAGEAAVAADQLPDPKLTLGLQNVPVSGPDAFTVGQDFMTMRMIGVMQEFPRKAKRKLRADLARLDEEQKQVELAALQRMLARDVGLAWIDAWYSIRAEEVAAALLKENALQIESLTAGLRGGRVEPVDVGAARVEFELLKDREAGFKGRTAVARAELSRWIGEDASRPFPIDPPAFRQPPPIQQLLEQIEEHPRLIAFSKQLQIAETDARLAQNAAKPDWNVELAYQQRGSAYSNMVSIQFGIDLPLFQGNRQHRLALSKLSEAQRARLQREDDLRQMRAELARLSAERESAASRAAAFRDRILPEAQRRLDTANASYRAGRGSLAAVLEARKALLELKLEQFDREAQASRAALQLAYFARVEEGQ